MICGANRIFLRVRRGRGLGKVVPDPITGICLLLPTTIVEFKLRQLHIEEDIPELFIIWKLAPVSIYQLESGVCSCRVLKNIGRSVG